MPLDPDAIRQFIRDLIAANPRNDRSGRAIVASIPRGDEMLDTPVLDVLSAVTIGDFFDMVDAANADD